MIRDLFVRISLSLEQLNALPSIALGIGIAILTIFIPLAIATLQDVYRKRRDRNIEFADLDLNVVLDRVFRIRWLLVYVAMVFIPMVFWEISGGALRLFELALFLVGLGLMVKSVLAVYRWVKGDVFQFRFDYLRRLKNHKDLVTVWPSVWQAKDITIQSETRFFQMFSSTIEELLENNEVKVLKVGLALLHSFGEFAENRSLTLLAVFKEPFPKILDWHYKIWNREHLCLGLDEKIDTWSTYSEIGRVLDSVILEIEGRSLKDKGIASFAFFKYLKAHLEEQKQRYATVENDRRYYAEALLETFYQSFFESIADSPSRRDIWIRRFPEQWKVTKSNIRHSGMSRISWYQFQSWALDRIWPPRQELDKNLDDVVANLFPEVEPRVWSRILILAFSPDDQNKVWSAIEHHWNFGHSYSRRSRHRSYARHQGEDDKAFYRRIDEAKHVQVEKETKRTFELACFLFPQEFSQETAEKYVRELQGLKRVEGSIGERHRSELLDIFSQMLKFFDQPSAISASPAPDLPSNH